MNCCRGDTLYCLWRNTRSQRLATEGGATVTDNKYTGQREEVEIGLYYYVARWYDPVLAHFIQADTVVPYPGFSLSFLRYAYVNFNPIRLTDPTGHYGWDGGGGSTTTTTITATSTTTGTTYIYNYNTGLQVTTKPKSSKGGSTNQNTGAKSNGKGSSSIISNVLSNVDQWLWKNVPSTSGVHAGVGGQVGFIGEVGGATDIELVFNWRSGQIGILTVYGDYGYGGTPNGAGGYFYSGYSNYFGVSNIENLGGPSVYGGGTVTADAIAKVGLSLYGGAALDQNSPGQVLIDSKSQQPITFNQIDFNLGINAIANAVEGGVMVGKSNTNVNTVINIYPVWFRKLVGIK